MAQFHHIKVLLPLSSSVTSFMDFSFAGLNTTQPGTWIIGLPIVKVTGGLKGIACIGV